MTKRETSVWTIIISLVFVFLLRCGSPDSLYPLESHDVDSGPQDAWTDRTGRIPTTVLAPDAGRHGFFYPILSADDGHALRATLVWNPQLAIDVTDIDIHLMHPDGNQWGSPPLDCFYSNMSPMWDGDESFSPALDRDDIDGHGPENIVLKRIPSSEYGRAYRVGVVFFSNHTQRDPSLAYVQISCLGIVTQLGPVSMNDGDIWRVADLSMSNVSCTVTPLGIVTHYGQDAYSLR